MRWRQALRRRFTDPALFLALTQYPSREDFMPRFEKIQRTYEIDRIQDKAIRLHHRQRGTDVSNYGQAVAMGDIMENLEAIEVDDNKGEEPVPVWVKALFLLEANWSRLDAVRETDRCSMELAEAWGLTEEQQARLDSWDPSLYEGEPDPPAPPDPLLIFLEGVLPGTPPRLHSLPGSNLPPFSVPELPPPEPLPELETPLPTGGTPSGGQGPLRGSNGTGRGRRQGLKEGADAEPFDGYGGVGAEPDQATTAREGSYRTGMRVAQEEYEAETGRAFVEEGEGDPGLGWLGAAEPLSTGQWISPEAGPESATRRKGAKGGTRSERESLSAGQATQSPGQATNLDTQTTSGSEQVTDSTAASGTGLSRGDGPGASAAVPKPVPKKGSRAKKAPAGKKEDVQEEPRPEEGGAAENGTGEGGGTAEAVLEVAPEKVPKPGQKKRVAAKNKPGVDVDGLAGDRTGEGGESSAALRTTAAPKKKSPRKQKEDVQEEVQFIDDGLQESLQVEAKAAPKKKGRSKKEVGEDAVGEGVVLEAEQDMLGTAIVDGTAKSKRVRKKKEA
eukprot:jgi/Botrbrau1/990/Bobra.114_1s0030.1